MKRFAGIFVIALAMTITVIAQTSSTSPAKPETLTNGNSWSQQWFRAKYGRPSPLEESRLNAEQANTAYREATPSSAAMPFDNGAEQRYRTKYGRPSPLEESRLNAEQANTAYRETTPSAVAMPFDNGAEQRYRAKYGRPSPLEEARLKAQAR
jgi:hypothetical protein